MKRKRKKSGFRILSAMAVLSLCLGGCGSPRNETVYGSFALTNAASGTDQKDNSPLVESRAPSQDAPGTNVPPQTVPGTNTSPQPDLSTVPQATVESIQALNDGKAVFCFSDEGYLTFLKGRYCEQKITTWEEAADSLNSMAKLLGITGGSDWLVTYGESDHAGYTYWVLQQKYDGVTVAYGTLRIAVGPDGYTAGLSSSIIPEMGIAPETPKITAAEAEAVVNQFMSEACGSIPYQIYSEYTVDSIFSYGGQIQRVYCIYTSNPVFQAGSSFDMPFLLHLVTMKGDYFMRLPALTATADRGTSIDNSGYFDNLEQTSWTGKVTWSDGSVHEITVPVAYRAKDGLYYLADVNRKIIMADHNTFMDNYSGELAFTTSATNTDWPDHQLMLMYQYCRAYDFYASYGIRSTDGMETPILILTDWTENGIAPVNATHCGLLYGWIVFEASQGGHLEQSLDVIAHEFTHGITSTALCGTFYVNETGAINEAYSDIFAEIIEHMAGEGDPEWKLGQNSVPMRNMSAPLEYGQPAYVGDRFYCSDTEYPNNYTDNGGVHINSSLLNGVAYDINAGGLPLEQQARLWLTTTNLLTPRNSYDEIYVALLMSMEINGIDAGYGEIIRQAFESRGLFGDRKTRASRTEKAGHGRFEVHVGKDLLPSLARLYPGLVDLNTGTYQQMDDYQIADPEGNISLLLPAGNYVFSIFFLRDNQICEAMLMADGSWSTSGSPVYYPLGEGEVITLPDINSIR